MTASMTSPMKVTVGGKCTLAGEHAVIRGGAAVLIPAPDLRLQMEWCEGQGTEPTTAIALDCLSDLVARAREWAAANDIALATPHLTSLVSTIPAGAGLGSSAALSVALAHAFLGRSAPENDIARGPGSTFISALATHLENAFHGKSSGMDVAAVLAAAPILYRRGFPVERLKIPSEFRFTLHDSGHRSETRLCVEKVRALDSPALDAEMAAAVALAEHAIRTGSLAELAAAMERTTEVYRAWGLYTPALEETLARLLSDGARAVRLTGSGLGGHFVALRDAPNP